MSFNIVSFFDPKQPMTPEMIRGIPAEDLAKLLNDCKSEYQATIDDQAKKISELSRSKICNFAQGETLEKLTDVEISEIVRNKLSSHSYKSINVDTGYADYWYAGDIKCRIIVIKRGKIHFAEPFKAFFTTLFKANSVYTKGYNDKAICGYLLGAGYVDEEKAKDDLNTVYWQCKTITIFVPEKLDRDAKIHLKNGSKLISMSIDAGSWFRNMYEVIANKKGKK